MRRIRRVSNAVGNSIQWVDVRLTGVNFYKVDAIGMAQPPWTPSSQLFRDADQSQLSRDGNRDTVSQVPRPVQHVLRTSNGNKGFEC